MRKFNILTAIIAAAVVMAACDKKQLLAEPTLTLTPSENMEFTSDGGTRTIAVETDHSGWSVVSSQEWCVVSKSDDGKAFSITAAPHESKDAKPQAIVTVTAGSATRTILVDQKEKKPMEFQYLELMYIEARSTPGAGYYQFKFTLQPEQSTVYYTFCALYGDVVPGRSALTGVPKGTFSIGADKSAGTLAPGTGESKLHALLGTYHMHLMHGEPHMALLMKGGTMTVTGTGDQINDPLDITMEFEAEDADTGETKVYRAHYSYTGDAAHQPILTYIPAVDIEPFETTFTSVKSAVMGTTGAGTKYATVTLLDDSERKEAQFLIFMDGSATDGIPAGTYAAYAAENEYIAGTIMPGVYSPGYFLENTYYYELNPNGTYDVVLPFNGKDQRGSVIQNVSNSITVARNGNDYDIGIELYGPNWRCSGKNSVLKGSYNGPVEFQTAQGGAK